MCKHEKLAFLGYQETLRDEEYLMLYSCLDCKTTISMKKRPEREIKKKIEILEKKYAI